MFFEPVMSLYIEPEAYSWMGLFICDPARLFLGLLTSYHRLPPRLLCRLPPCLPPVAYHTPAVIPEGLTLLRRGSPPPTFLHTTLAPNLPLLNGLFLS